MKNKIIKIIYSALIMLVGLIILKYIPMQIFGKDILFDASQHIVVAGFILYLGYVIIGYKDKIMIPYYFLSFMVLTFIAIQRIITNAHNDIGLILGLIVVTLGILIPQWKEVMK